MPAQFFGAQAAVTFLNRAFANTSPSNAAFNNQVTNATAALAAGADATQASSYTGFAKTFGAAYASQTPAALSTLLMTNLGLLPNAALETALADYISAVGTANVGIVALQLATLLSAKEGDATYGTAATAWNNEVNSAATYSTNPANTTAQTGDVTPPPANQGQTFTLTTSVDNLTGTVGTDTFKGVLSATATEQTFGSGDIINGGAGNDTLELLGNGVTGTPLVQTDAVEAVVMRAVGATAISQQLMNGVTTFTSKGSNAAVTVNNGSLNTTYALESTVAGQTAGLTVNYTSVTGTADTAKLSISNAGDKTGSTTTTQTIDVANGNGIEAVTLATTGTNYVSLAAGTGAKTITVTGDGTNDLTVSSAAASMTLDASGTTGANTLRVGTQLSGAGDNVKGGSGADTLIASLSTTTVAALSGIETLDLTFTAGALFNASSVTDVKTLDITNTGAATFSNLAASVDTIKFDTSTGGAGATLGYAGAPTAAIGVTVGKTTTAGTSTDAIAVGGLTLSGTTGAVTVTSVSDKATTTNTTGAIALGNATSLTIDASTAAITAGALTGTKATSLALQATKGAVATGTFGNADALATITAAATAGNITTGQIDGDDSLTTITLSAGATSGTDHSVTTSIGKSGTAAAKAVSATLNVSGEGDVTVTTVGTDTFIGTVNASESTGSVALNLQAYTGSSAFVVTLGNAGTGEANTVNISGGSGASVVTGGSGADTITGGSGADVINGGAGNDVLDGGAGADVIDAGAGTDTVTGGAGADVITLTETTAAVDTVKYVALAAGVATEGGDTITGFGTNDILQFNALATNYNLGDDNTTVVSVVGAGAAGVAASELVINTTAFANLAAVEAGLAAMAGAVTAGQGVLLVAGDAANTYVYHDADGLTAGGTTLIATLTGVSIANVTAANFSFIN